MVLCLLCGQVSLIYDMVLCPLCGLVSLYDMVLCLLCGQDMYKHYVIDDGLPSLLWTSYLKWCRCDVLTIMLWAR